MNKVLEDNKKIKEKEGKTWTTLEGRNVKQSYGKKGAKIREWKGNTIEKEKK